MPPTLRASHPPTRSAHRFTYWDALVAIALGLGLVAVGWADWQDYRLSTGQLMDTSGLVGQQGDVRLGEEEFFHNKEMAVHLRNVGGREYDAGLPLRHTYGPDLTVEIWAASTSAQIDFSFANDFPSQDLTVSINGQELEQIHLAPGRIERSYHVPLHPGANQFTIAFAVYNGHGIVFENGETRPVAGTFHKLDVHL